MKYYIDKIIVVEGKEDVSYLSSFIEAEYVSLNVYDIPNEEIEYLNEAQKHKEILVLTDPDEAGRNIEKRLREKLVKATYLNIDIHQWNRGKKDGVAEAIKEEILRVLKPYILDKKSEKSGVLQGKINKLDLNDKELREYICTKYKLGKCNLKKIIYRLETLEISDEEVKKTINEFYAN